MTKRRTLLGMLLVVILSFVCAAFVACKEPEMYTIKWTVPQNGATVTASGYEELPTEVEAGTVVSFTVDLETGYQLDNVRINSTAAKAENGVYSLEVQKNSTIVVNVSEKLSSVEVTPPTNLTYYVGQSVDTAGMVVKAKYETGTEKTVTDYTINYANGGSAFAMGETSFTVTYNDLTSEAVNLAAPVVALVTINPVGGVTDELEALLEANTEIANLNVADDGVITFTYTALTADIVLPEEIAHKNGEDWGFIGWINPNNVTDEGAEAVTKIAAGSVASFSIQAAWTAVLVEFKSLDLVMENGTPYLVLDLVLGGVDEAYLYLFEGNQKLTFKGDPIDGMSGEEATLKFDLTKFSGIENIENYYGAWMDIRVMTTISGVDITQDIPLDQANPIAQVGKMIYDANHCYRFLTYNSNANQHDLKICVNKYNYTYDVQLAEREGKAYADFTGTIAPDNMPEDYKGGSLVAIQFGALVGEGALNKDGTFALSIELGTEPLSVTAGAISVVTKTIKNEGLENEYEDIVTTYTDDTMDLIGCGTSFAFDPAGSTPRWYKNSLTVDKYIYCVGVDWNEPFITVGFAEGYEINRTTADIVTKTETRTETVEGKEVEVQVQVPYFVIYGTYGSNYTDIEVVKQLVLATFKDLANNEADNAYNSNIAGYDPVITEATVEAANGEWQMYVSLETAQEGHALFAHMSDGDLSWNGLEMNDTEIIIGDTYYILGDFTGWSGHVVTVYVVSKDALPRYTGTAVDLVVEENVIYFVVNGTWDKDLITKAELEALFATQEGLYFDLQGNGSYEGNDWNNNDIYEELKTYTVTVNEDGTWSLKVDITSLTGTAYTAHLGYAPAGSENVGADLKLGAEFNGIAVNANGKGYTIVSKPGSGEGVDFWGCIGLRIGDPVEESKPTPGPDPVAPADYDIEFGEEKVADENAGKWYYWASKKEWSLPAEVTVSVAKYDGETDTATFTYSSDGSVWYGMQMFYQNATNVVGKTYTVTCVITAETACEVTINGQLVSLNAGANNITLTIVEPELSNGNPAASFAIQMGKADGDVMVTANTISISGLKFEEVVPEVSYAATAVNLTAEEDKVYFTLSGTWDKTVSSKADVEAYFANKDKFYFDLQENAFFVTGDWGGAWTEHDIYDELKAYTITVNEDGTWSLKVDISSLKAYGYSMHFGYHANYPNGDNTGADYRLSADLNGITVTANGKKYTIVSDPTAVDDATKFWGNIGLVVADLNAKTAAVTGVAFEVRDGKPYYVLRGTYENCTEADLDVRFARMSDWSNIEFTPVVTLNADQGTFEMAVDLSDVGLEGDMLSHFFVDGNSKDVEIAGAADGTISTITVNGKVYTARIEAGKTWNAPKVIFTITEEAAA